ncbi:hypothetical protein [Streptomyces sp. NRRL S-1448]|uniref:hypothetical protein n=1 Tax=Streptomyces sp. NRRL S-1448 TaxID=1463883 RepID=UPI0004C1E185|nr:hypothetical protein [Streptomyces sp. NRRL S-1448]
MTDPITGDIIVGAAGNLAATGISYGIARLADGVRAARDRLCSAIHRSTPEEQATALANYDTATAELLLRINGNQDVTLAHAELATIVERILTAYVDRYPRARSELQNLTANTRHSVVQSAYDQATAIGEVHGSLTINHGKSGEAQ